MGQGFDILIAAPCTGSKTWRGRTLDFNELQKWHAGALPDADAWPRIPAAQLYDGLSHRRMMQGISAYRSVGAGRVELYIVSAGMGVVEEKEPIPPYEATFVGMRGSARTNWAQTLGIPGRMAEVLQRPAHLRLVLLGRDYLDVARLSDVACPTPTVVLAAPSAAGAVPHGALHVPLGQREAVRFHHTLVALKGELVRRLLAAVARRVREHADVGALPAWRDAGAFLQLCEEIP